MTYQPVVGINPIYKSGSVTRWHANPDEPARFAELRTGKMADPTPAACVARRVGAALRLRRRYCSGNHRAY